MGEYTDQVKDGYWSYAERTASETKDMVGDMEEEATIKDWEELLEKIRREYTCSVRLFLMRYLFEGGEHIPGKTTGEGEGYRIDYGGRTYPFHGVSPGYAFALPDEERDRYVELLTRIAADRHGDPPRVWRPLMRKAMLRNKKVRLLTRHEGFQLAHGLGFGLDKTEEFLLRALENDGFCYTRSEDVIEAFCFLYGPADNWYTAQQLKAWYHEQADHLPKQEVALKPDAFTRKMAQSLPAAILEWTAGSGAEPEQDTEGGAQDGGQRDVTGRFKAWLLSQAPVLDIPSRSAYQIYRRAAVFAHKLTRALSSDAADRQEALLAPLFSGYLDGEGTYLTDMIKRYCLGDGEGRERGEAGEKGTDGREAADVKAAAAEAVEDPYRVASDLLWMAYDEAAAGLDRRSGEDPAKLWRYLTADQNGRLTVKAAGSRIPLLLSGTETVTKADLLFLLWVTCDLSWMIWEQDTEDFLYERLEGFWSLAEELLEQAMLPGLYAPHLLERCFLYAICAQPPTDESPFTLYEELCSFALPEKGGRHRLKKVDPAEGRRYRRLQERKVRELYRTGQLDLEGLGEVLSRHFREHGKEGGCYRFTPEGICYQEKKPAVLDPKEPAAVLYPRAGTGKRFDKSREDYKTPRAQEERFQFLYGLALDLADKAGAGYKVKMRINCKDKASMTIQQLYNDRHKR